jgi:hypothetical protein
VNEWEDNNGNKPGIMHLGGVTDSEFGKGGIHSWSSDLDRTFVWQDRKRCFLRLRPRVYEAE